MQFFAVFAAIVAVGVAMPTATPVQSTWTLQELDAALQDPNTDAALIPFLEHAMNQIMDALHAGMQIDSVAIHFPAEIIPTPVAVAPVEITPTPVAVAPVESAPAADASSAIVQIIINVNGQTVSVPVAIPSPVPSPALVPEINPTPVVVVEEAFESIPASPVQVVEISPEPVLVAEPAQVNPIDVIAVGAPEVITNPIIAGPAVEVGPM